MAIWSISRTEHHVPDSVLWRQGSPSHQEAEADLAGYQRMLEQVHNGALHDWGVVEGLTVLATPGYATVRLSPGVAVDSLGRHLVLRTGGTVEVSPDPVHSGQLLGIGADGVDLTTIGRTDVCRLSVQWRETFDQQTLDTSQGQTFLTRHTPWLRLDPVADVPQDGTWVVLATLVLDAAGLVTMDGATAEGRRRPTPAVGRLRIHRPQARSSGGAVTVLDVPAATLAPLPGGGLAVELPDADGEPALHLPGRGLQIGTGADASAHYQWRSELTPTPALRLYNGDFGSSSQLLSVQPDGRTGLGVDAAKGRLHVSAEGGFGAETADGVLQSSAVPLLAQSDSTAIGVLNADGRAAFALNVDGNGHTAQARGVPTFYDRFDGAWHPAISLKLGRVGINDGDPDYPLTVPLGARFGEVTAGVNPPGLNYVYPYESVGVSQSSYNLRLQSPNSVFIHTNAAPGKTVGTVQVDPAGRIGLGNADRPPKARLHATDVGGFGSEDAGGALVNCDVPLLAQSDSTAIGVLNADGRPAFALNIDGNGHTAQARGVPTFYDRYDGTWHPAISLKQGRVGIGDTDPEYPLTVPGGARFGGVTAGVNPASFTYAFPYESVGVSEPNYNLRLQSANSVFIHTGAGPGKNPTVVEVDPFGRIGLFGRSPTPVTVGWGGGLRTWDVEAEGSIWCANDIFGRQFKNGHGDVAENFPAEQPIEPGLVVCFAEDAHHVEVSTPDRSAAVIGVVSTSPAMTLKDGGPEHDGGGLVPVALCGRVPCRATDENGPIGLGDLLTVARTPGHAMRAGSESGGAILGKALGTLESGDALIDILIALA